MPIELGFWRLNGNQPARLESAGLDLESRLEDILASAQIQEEVSFTKVSTQPRPNFQPSFSQTSIDRFLLHA